MLNISLQKSDYIGAISSCLCMIHCIATPFIFFATVCTSSCCSSAPLWWQCLDYIFLFISFIAVYQSTKSTNSKLIKFSLWSSWVVLLLSILNMKFAWLNISENIKFVPAFSLILLHLYNFKYYRFNTKNCC